MMHLHVILSRLINKQTYGVIDNMQKFFGLALCFMGEFLLCFGKHGFMDARTINVLSQIKDGNNPVSLILAETLLGLDSVSWWKVSKLSWESLDFADMANGTTGYDC